MFLKILHETTLIYLEMNRVGGNTGFIKDQNFVKT